MDNETCLKVRFYETDAMGVVHHSNYLKWLEVARFDFAEKFMPNTYRMMYKKNMYLPVIKAELSYKEYINYGDVIYIRTYLVKNDAAKLGFYSTLTKNKSQKKVAIGYTEHAFVDEDKKMFLNIPSFALEDLRTIQMFYPQYILNSVKVNGHKYL